MEGKGIRTSRGGYQKWAERESYSKKGDQTLKARVRVRIDLEPRQAEHAAGKRSAAARGVIRQKSSRGEAVEELNVLLVLPMSAFET